MNNFEFYNPTKVIFGQGVEKNVGKALKEYGAKKVLLHYGGKSAEKSGLLAIISASLQEVGIQYVSLGGAQPNPVVSLVRSACALCKAEKVDFILAIGGGSAIDSAKATAMAVYNDCDPWDIYAGKIAPSKALPLAAVLTIAAAGSETSNSSVITNEEGGLKRGYNHDCIRPVFAFMNPELTYTLPTYQTASGCVDILMHTLERYFTNVENVDLTDRLSEGLLLSVLENAKILVKDPKNYHARAEIMWAGSISHNGLMGTGRTPDFASHQIEHELGGMFDVAHGAGLSAIWGSWARYVMQVNIHKFVQLANRVFFIETKASLAETALAGICEMEEFFKEIAMPISIGELGIKNLSDAQIQELAHKCTFFGARKVGQFKQLDKADIIKILEMAR